MREIILADKTEYSLDVFDNLGISYIPCGNLSGKDQPLFQFKGLWGKTQHIGMDNFDTYHGDHYLESNMTGVQIFTGTPSFRKKGKLNSYLVDIDIEKQMVSDHKDAVLQIIDTYRNSVQFPQKPSIILTKSGGFRLSMFNDYHGPKIWWKSEKDEMLLEIFSKHGLSRIDHRYEQLEGSLYRIPDVPKSVPQEIYLITDKIGNRSSMKTTSNTVVDKSTIGDLDIEWSEKTIGKKKVLESQKFTTEHCHLTSHLSNREEVKFTRHPNGAIEGFCFNCQENWWEKTPAQPAQRSRMNFGMNFNMNLRRK